MPTDALMERYARGDDDAFPALYRALAPWLTRLIRRLVHDPATTEDILQATFLRLHRARARYRPGHPVAPFVWVIARRLALDALRRRPLLLDASDDSPSSEPTPHDHLEAKRLGECVMAHLAQMPPDHVEALRLSRIEGLGNHDAARLLDTTVMAVKLRTFRATQRLRRLLDDAPPRTAGSPRCRTPSRASSSAGARAT